MQHFFSATARLWLVAVLLFTTVVAYGQGGARSGKVTSQTDGAPVPGANVSVKGTSRGVITDANGTYSIQATDNATLVFSFIGFKA